METTNKENLTEALAWRYATKHFDSSKVLNQEQLDFLLEAIQMAPSSYGLQPYQVLVITDHEVREQLKAAAYGQAQITDASHLFVFARTKNFTTEHVDEYAHNISSTRKIELESIKGFVDVMKGTVSSRSQDELANWNAKQAYIALGFLLEAAALNEIDACPMEGFDNTKFDEILGLDAKNLASVVIAPVGFRSADDAYQHFQKVRKSKHQLFIHI